MIDFRWTSHPAIVTIPQSKHYIRVLLYSPYTTTTGWGGPPEKDCATEDPPNSVMLGVRRLGGLEGWRGRLARLDCWRLGLDWRVGGLEGRKVRSLAPTIRI